MKIRRATEHDLPPIVAIYNAAVATRMSTADLEPVAVAQRQLWFEAHSAERHPLWVMDDDGRVAGWLGLEVFHPRIGYKATAEVSAYVAPDRFRQGIGRALLKEALRQAPGLGLTNLVALVFGHNIPSLLLFEGAGFEPWGRLPGIAKLDGIERDLVIVGRRV